MRIGAYFGIAARRIAFQHLRGAAFFMFVLLIVAFAIDVTENLDEIRQAAQLRGTSLLSLLLPYLGFRGVDIVTRLLPMACLIGSFTTEVLRHQRLENVILQAAGASTQFILTAIFLSGLGLGVVQAGMQGWARPEAVFAQVDLGLGKYARRYEKNETGFGWFLNEEQVLRARVIKSPPELREVLIFVGISSEGISEIIQANRAVPGAGQRDWKLLDATRWTETTSGRMTPERLPEIDIQFPLSSARVNYHGVSGHYIPLDMLHKITALKGQRGDANARTALLRRYTAIFLPIVFSLLGASLAQSGLSGRLLAPFRLLGLGVLGYVTLVSVKVFWALGERGEMPAIWACTVPLAFGVVLIVFLQLRLGGYIGRRRAPKRI